jgi:hypothetical protein
VIVRLTILGEPASKANSRELVKFGRGDKARPALIKSKKARDYERDALRQIPSAARAGLTGPVRVTLRIFYASERPDLDESVVLDVLQNRYHGKGEARVLGVLITGGSGFLGHALVEKLLADGCPRICIYSPERVRAGEDARRLQGRRAAALVHRRRARRQHRRRARASSARCSRSTR